MLDRKPTHGNALHLGRVGRRSELRPARGASSPARARRFVELVCSQLTKETLDVLRLLISELVANALWHGAGDPLQDIQVEDDLVTVGVTDLGDGEPTTPADRRWPETGHGLRLVEALSSRWGVSSR